MGGDDDSPQQLALHCLRIRTEENPRAYLDDIKRWLKWYFRTFAPTISNAPRPMTEVKLWYPGRVSVKVSRRPGARARTVGRTRAVAACQLLKIALPYQHGVATVTVHVGSAVERRTLVF